jgi:hypothetical protein
LTVTERIESTCGAGERTSRDLTRLRSAAGEAVGSAFYGTMLKMMRNDPFKGKYGHGGRGEEVFAGQLHGIMAEQMGTVMRRGPGEALYKHLARQQQRFSQQGPTMMEVNA